MTPNKSAVHLWEFLLELLADERCSSLIHWTKKEEREFKLKNQEEVARRWGNLKQRPGMNYDKLSRALRYYYQKNIIRKVSGQRLVYKFVELPYNYRPVKRWTQESGWAEKDQVDSISSDLIDLPAVNRKVAKPSLKPVPLSSSESLVYEEFKVIQEPLRARCEHCVTSESHRCQCPTVRRVIVAKPVPVIQTCGHAKSLPSLSYRN